MRAALTFVGNWEIFVSCFHVKIGGKKKKKKAIVKTLGWSVEEVPGLERSSSEKTKKC